MRALVLEKERSLTLREIDLPMKIGPRDVKIAVDTVGICGSDVHYYTHGRIGSFIVKSPMVLGHEAAGKVVEVGSEVKNFKPGDRVCMEPGVPDMASRASRMGLYNVDPSVTFWATPPVHGCLTAFVIHPEAFTYKLPDNVSFAEGALVEPFAIGMQGASKARIAPGDVALVIGSGTIGVMTALAALAGGCSRVLVTDLVQEKLDVVGRYSGVVTINGKTKKLAQEVAKLTDNWGADVVFEASGSPKAYDGIFDLVRPGGCLVLIGMPIDPVPFDVVAACVKEARIETVFRYANIHARAIELIASGKVDLKPLISGTFPFEQSIEAFERAASARPGDVKLQIKMPAVAATA
jgi:D-xylulose reductase